MERLIDPFYGVMHKYKKCFSGRGVRANINKWLARKAPLIALLRRHPDWDEDALAIVFQITEHRETENTVADEKRQQLLRFAETMELNADQLSSFRSALNLATDGYYTFLPETAAESIKTISGIKCASGQKASRVINRLCMQYGIDKHPEYNSVFAQISDTLNPITIERKALLSLHPCDYLEMSSKSSSWTSCHSLNGGAYQAGCLSYMTDAVSMIFYTVDNGITGEYHKAPRRGRQVFCYKDGLLMQSRLYPKDGDDDAMTLNRNLVQTAIARCLNLPNQWVLKRKRADISTYLRTTPGSRQYPDYNSYGVLSLLKGMDKPEYMEIGGESLCVCCGDKLTRNSSIQCNCANQVVCAECGETVMAVSARYHDDVWLCNRCAHVCEHCGIIVRDDLVPAFDGRGNIIHICQNCYAAALAPCAGCGVRDICGLVSGSRFCLKNSEAARRPAAAPLQQAA